jgi:hypothetical protein
MRSSGSQKLDTLLVTLGHIALYASWARATRYDEHVGKALSYQLCFRAVSRSALGIAALNTTRREVSCLEACIHWHLASGDVLSCLPWQKQK